MKYVVLALVLMLVISACDKQSETLKAVSNGGPVLNAEIDFKGERGTLRVDYRPGVVWVPLSLPVKVEKKPTGEYKITRSDNSEVIEFTPITDIPNQYVCTSCAFSDQGKDTLMIWVLK